MAPARDEKEKEVDTLVLSKPCLFVLWWSLWLLWLLGLLRWLWSRRDVCDMLCRYATTVLHLIMGAVSLWTRLPALYLCTAPKKSLPLIPAVKTDSWNLSLRQHSDVHHRR